MNERQINALRIRETDIEGVLRRLYWSDELFEKCLSEFLQDSTIDKLNMSVDNGSWDEAFTAVHALKGMAGNMGFYPLMHKTGQLIVLIRGGRMNEIPESLNELNSSYRDIIDGINQYFANADENVKEHRK